MPPINPDTKLIIDVGKILAYIALAYGLYRVAKPIYLLYDAVRVVVAEHRMLMQDLWARHPEKRDDFYTAVSESRVVKAMSKAAGR